MDTDWNNLSIHDLPDYIKSILTIRWHSPNEDEEEDIGSIKFYPHNVHLIDEAPDEADSNHGCFIVFVKISGTFGERKLGSIKTGFFDTDGSFISAIDQNNKYKDTKSFSDEELKKFDFFDTLKETDYKNLCKDIKLLSIKDKEAKK